MARDGIPSAVCSMPSARSSSSRRRGRIWRRSWLTAASWSTSRPRAAMLAEMGYRAHPRARRATGPRSGTCAGAAPPSCRSRYSVAAAGRPRGRPAGGDPLPRLPRGARHAGAPAGRRAPGRGLQLGRLAARRARAHRPARPRRRGRHLIGARRRQARSRHLPRRAGPVGASAADAMHVGDSVEADVAARAPPAASRRCSSPATAGRPPACASWLLDGLLMT